MTQQEIEQYILQNKQILTTEKRAYVDGNSPPSNPVSGVAYIALVGDVQLSDKMFKTEEAALKFGAAVIEGLEK